MIADIKDSSVILAFPTPPLFPLLLLFFTPDKNINPCPWSLFTSAKHGWIRQLLKQGLDWDWTGTGLELDWSILVKGGLISTY